MQEQDFSSYKIIGLMSGTSLDGLDICYAEFSRKQSEWSYKIIQTKAVDYPVLLLNQLKIATQLSGLDLFLLDQELGSFYGKAVNEFIAEFKLNKLEIDVIASHGQTIFHQPEKKLTVQIGCGASIASETGIDVINDFRKKDVLHGGQGAPLVPIGDKLLFSSYAQSFLNIGGFANFSVLNDNDSVTAFDICPVNIVLNYYTRQLGLEFDKNGSVASKNETNTDLLSELNSLKIYSEKQPKSLGWEWVEEKMLPLIEKYDVSIESTIATVTEHAAFQIAKRLNEAGCSSVFVTGGGAKNAFLIARIKHYFNGEISIPSVETIDFKEALIFGFLGALNLEGIANCIPSVTGADKAVVGGVRWSK